MVVLSVRFAFYVFDVYIGAFDGSHDCKGNMLDWDKRFHTSIEGNFMMNNKQVVFFCLNKLSVISLTFFFTTVLFHETGT